MRPALKLADSPSPTKAKTMSVSPFPAAPTADTTAASALSGLLFDDFRAHRPWAELITDPDFSHRSALPATEQIELAYHRLRRVNALVEAPLALATDPVRLAALHEWTAVVDGRLTSLASIHYNLHLGSLAEADHDPGRRLDDVVAMRRVGTLLATEWGHGADAAALETTATRCPTTGGFTLHSPSKRAWKFMPNTSSRGGPKDGLVAARLLVDGTDHGAFLFQVPLTGPGGPLPGIHIHELPAGSGPLDHCLTAFDSVRLPAHALLQGEHGTISATGTFSSTVPGQRQRFLHSIHRVTQGRLCMSAAAVGISRAAVATAVHYSIHRQVSAAGGTTVPLAAHRSHHARLLTAMAHAYALTLLHRTTLNAWTRGDSSRRQVLDREVALLKATATWRAREIVEEMRECCGAHGLLAAAGFTGWLQPLSGAITAEGDNRAIAAKAAAELLEEPTVPHPAVPVTSLDPRTTTLRDLRSLLAAAEAIAAERARTRLLFTPGLDRLGRWNAGCQPALDAARAHTAGAAAKALADAVDDCEHESAQSLLEHLGRLYVLRELRPYLADLLAEGYVTPAAVRQLPDAVDDITGTLVPHMLTLTAAFALERYLASVPLAHANYQHGYANYQHAYGPTAGQPDDRAQTPGGRAA